MFERYTENARRTIFFARSEAIQSGSSFIEPEHIVLALLKHDWMRSGYLENLNEPEFRAKFITNIPENTPKTEDIPLSNISKRILNHSAEEADILLHSHIGTEHLLLGVLREKHCDVALALNQIGLTIESLRKSIRQDLVEERKLMNEQATTRSRCIGIPQGFIFYRLLYNAASETVIAELKHEKDNRRRLVARHKSKEEYEVIGNLPDDISCESPVTCNDKPVLVFNSVQYTETGSGWWRGVYAFDLLARELTLIVSSNNFISLEPYKGGWIANILGLSNDASCAYVKAGLEMHFANGKKMDYYIAGINLKSREVELISRLKGAFL